MLLRELGERCISLNPGFRFLGYTSRAWRDFVRPICTNGPVVGHHPPELLPSPNYYLKRHFCLASRIRPRGVILFPSW